MSSAQPSPHPRLLLTGPAGCGKTHRACERIRAAATREGARGRGAAPPGASLLVLPTYAQAMHLERVALSRWDARAILDDPFATFTSAGERFLAGFRVRGLPSAVERDRLMEEALRRAEVEAFEAVRDRPGFRARLLRLAKEIKQSGRPVADASARLAAAGAELTEGARERLEGFLVVFEHYERLLDRAGLEDHEDTLRRLLEQLQSAPPAEPPRLLVVDGFDDFTPVEQGILDALTEAVTASGGEVLVTLPYDDARPRLFAASEPARRHLLGRGFVEERLAGFRRAERAAAPRALAALAGRLFLRGDAAGPVEPGGSVRLVVAGDPEDEAEALAREARRAWREGALPRGWRDLGVVVRRLDDAGPRIAAAFARLGIPVRLIGGGDALAAEAYVRAVRGPLRVLGGQVGAGRFEVAPLLTWLRWRAREDADATARVDRLEIHWRGTGFPASFEAFGRAVADAGLDAGDLDRQATSIGALRGAAVLWDAIEEAVLSLAELPPEGGLDPDTGTPVDADADRRRVRAAAARDRLVGLIRGHARAAARTGLDEDVTASEAVEVLLESIDHAHLNLPDRRLDAVNVLDAEEARFWELPIVFAAGLSQGSFPLHPREDVLLRDEERETLAVGLSLPLARDRERRERRLFYGALTRAKRTLVLFRSGCDEGGDARAPSLYLRDVERVVSLDGVTTRRPVSQAAPARAECFTVHDWTLFAAARSRDPGAGEEDRALARALLARGDETLLCRAARWGRTEADALEEPDRWRDRFQASVARVSPSAVGVGLACRHRFFLKYVVGVPEDEVPFDGPAYGYREMGTLVHEALERALTDAETEPEAIADAVLADAPRDRAPAAIDREGEAQELARIVRLFRRREEALGSTLRPVDGGLELSFGRDEDVVLRQGDRSLSLHGQIDRVDWRAGRAAIIDYKRSGGAARGARDRYRDGLDVQLPLYAHAVKAILGLDVVGFEWVAALVRERYGVWREDAFALAGPGRAEGGRLDVPTADDFESVLDAALDRSLDVVEAVRALDAGRQRDDAKRCGDCAWRSVCRPAFAPREPAS